MEISPLTLTLVVKYEITEHYTVLEIMQAIDELIEKAREGGAPSSAELAGFPTTVDLM